MRGMKPRLFAKQLARIANTFCLLVNLSIPRRSVDVAILTDCIAPNVIITCLAIRSVARSALNMQH